MLLVEIAPPRFDVELDIAYATADNVAGQPGTVYPDTEVEPWLSAMMVLLAFAGTQASRPVLERMNDASFRLWTKWTVLATGVFYLASGVTTIRSGGMRKKSRRSWRVKSEIVKMPLAFVSARRSSQRPRRKRQRLFPRA